MDHFGVIIYPRIRRVGWDLFRGNPLHPGGVEGGDVVRVMLESTFWMDLRELRIKIAYVQAAYLNVKSQFSSFLEVS